MKEWDTREAVSCPKSHSCFAAGRRLPWDPHSLRSFLCGWPWSSGGERRLGTRANFLVEHGPLVNRVMIFRMFLANDWPWVNRTQDHAGRPLENITSAMQTLWAIRWKCVITAVLHSGSEPVILTYNSGWRSSEGSVALGSFSQHPRVLLTSSGPLKLLSKALHRRALDLCDMIY